MKQKIHAACRQNCISQLYTTERGNTKYFDLNRVHSHTSSKMKGFENTFFGPRKKHGIRENEYGFSCFGIYDLSMNCCSEISILKVERKRTRKKIASSHTFMSYCYVI